jgi:hypothetical protein
MTVYKVLTRLLKIKFVQQALILVHSLSISLKETWTGFLLLIGGDGNAVVGDGCNGLRRTSRMPKGIHGLHCGSQAACLLFCWNLNNCPGRVSQ